MSNVFGDVEGRNWLSSLLRGGEVTVVFTKIDGTERVMRCTLQESVLPKVEPSTKSRKKSEESISVWDLDEDGWRSFRWDSIKEIIFG